MSFREIGEEDLPEVVTLLAEGFPRRRPNYWRRGLANMRALPPVPGYPRHGYLLEEDGAVQGVILLLSTKINNAAPRANLSSWYVRDAYRTKAPILYQLATMQDHGLHVNLSPAAHVVPIAKAFGFKSYTSGVCLIDARASLRPARRWRLTRYRPVLAGTISAPMAEVAARHLGYGCSVLMLQNGVAPPELLIYRPKFIKGCIPCAQILHGSTDHVLAAAGPLMRHLLRRGILFALVDIGEATRTDGFPSYPGHCLRYSKGGAPEIGDLLDSEYAVFGP